MLIWGTAALKRTRFEFEATWSSLAFDSITCKLSFTLHSMRRGGQFGAGQSFAGRPFLSDTDSLQFGPSDLFLRRNWSGQKWKKSAPSRGQVGSKSAPALRRIARKIQGQNRFSLKSESERTSGHRKSAVSYIDCPSYPSAPLLLVEPTYRQFLLH